MLKVKTFEQIMSDMLSQIPNDIDKEQGSIIYDALAPAAIELNDMYFKLQDAFRLMFVRTSEGEYLTELAFQFGINRLKATKSIREAQFNIAVTVGTRFSVADSDLNFVVIENNGQSYKLECESPGSEGNFVQGFLIPIDYLSGLTPVNIGEVILLGEDEEDDESLRKRTIAHITRPEQDGNVDQYLRWANEYPGIGNATIIPLWNGANTVKVVITDANGDTASEELVSKFQEYLDPKTEGRGEGKAPIGAFVTVASATVQKVEVSIIITLNREYTLNGALTSINEVVKDYMKTATNQKYFKKYELATLIDALREVDYIVDFPGNDVVPLNPSSIFEAGAVNVQL